MENSNQNFEAQRISSRLNRVEQGLIDEIVKDEVDLRELFLSIWKGRWFILCATVFCAALSVAVSLYLPNEYKATVVLTPASTSSASSLARLASQFGGLAALAGISLGQDEDNKTVAAMELVKSWGFQEEFIRENHLEVEVFAARGWDRAANQLVIDPSTYDTKTRKWVRKFKASEGQTAQPSGWELYQELTERIAITQDKKTGLISLSVEYYSPYLAKDWADKLILAVNRHLQEQDRIDAERSIEYLQEKMSQTSLTEMKAVFARLIEEQTKNLMLTRVSDEYVLRTLAPAKVPEEKSSPKRAVICVVSTLLGCLLSVFIWMAWVSLGLRRELAT